MGWRSIVVGLEKNCWQFSFSFCMRTPDFWSGERVAGERERERKRPDLDGIVR